MCAKKKAARAIKPAGPPESPATSAEPIVMVGVFEVDEADPKYFHLLPAPDSKSYYRIPLAKAEFTLNAKADFKAALPSSGQAVIVRIMDIHTPIIYAESVAANYLKGPIVSAHLAPALTAASLAREGGHINLISRTVGCQCT